LKKKFNKKMQIMILSAFFKANYLQFFAFAVLALLVDAFELALPVLALLVVFELVAFDVSFILLALAWLVALPLAEVAFPVVLLLGILVHLP
jgi:hypothetical protein